MFPLCFPDITFLPAVYERVHVCTGTYTAIYAFFLYINNGTGIKHFYGIVEMMFE